MHRTQHPAVGTQHPAPSKVFSAAVMALVLVVGAGTLVAQRRGGGGGGLFDRFLGPGASDRSRNLTYDGRFTVARIQYAAYRGWRADYPVMERHLTTMLEALTSMTPHVEGSNVHTLDDPELMKYPVAYLSEPGYWYPERRRDARPPELPREGRLPDRRRLSLSERVGGLRAGHALGAARGEDRATRPLASRVQRVLPYRDARGPVSRPAR